MSGLAIVLPVRFHEAIRAASRRYVTLPDDYYSQLQGAARSEGFTVSGLASITQIRQVLDDLNEGLKEGMSFADWQARALERGFPLPPARVELLLRVHAQTAYMRGAYEQAQKNRDRRPYLIYSAINDSRTRPGHRSMDGIIRHIDDAFWDTHFPPCGFNCRCSVVSLTEEQVQARGGTTATIPTEAVADPGWGARPDDGARPAREAVARQQINAPEPLQSEIRKWHEEVLQERIVERVRAFVGPLYRDYAREVRPFVREMDGLITEHEAVALRAYSEAHYTVMNRYLRAEGGAENLDMMAMVAAATSGLAKLTPFEGRVYRGIWLENVGNPTRFLAGHNAGDVVEYLAFTSGSYSSGFSGNVTFTIHSRNGRVIERLAGNAEEREVLFMPGTKFRVVSVDKAASPVRIELEELEDQGVHVPASHRFDKNGQPEEKVSEATQRRAEDEARGADPDRLTQFAAQHDGMTPLQLALAKFPSARLEVEQAFPEIVSKKRP